MKRLVQRGRVGQQSLGRPSRRRECRIGRLLWKEIELHCGDLGTWLQRAPCGMVRKQWRLRTVAVVLDEEEGLQVWEDCGVCGWLDQLELGELGTSHTEEKEALPRTMAHDWDPRAETGGIA